MSVWTAVAIYIVGIVVGTIGFGAYVKPRSEFDNWDIALFVLLILFWPLMLVVGLLFAAIVGLFYATVFKAVRSLMYFGEDLSKCCREWYMGLRGRRESAKEVMA